MTQRPGRIDWGGLMRAGMRDKGLLPRDFWALTPAELLLMLGRDGGGTPAMGRARLEELAALWPDTGAAMNNAMDKAKDKDTSDE